MDTSLTVLPPGLQNINRIVMISHRIALHRAYDLFTVITRDYRRNSFDSSTRDMVDRFFSYLNNSCITPQLINMRAKWLITYFNALNHRLMVARSEQLVKHFPPPESEQEWVSFLEPFLAHLQAHAIIFSKKRVNNENITKLLSDIHSLIKRARIDPHNGDFVKLEELFDSIVEDLSQHLYSPSVVHELGFLKAEQSLMVLRYHIHHYVVTRHLS